MVQRVARGHIEDGRLLRRGGGFRCHAVAGAQLALFYLSSDFALKLRLGPVDYHRFVFQIRETSRIEVGREAFEIGPGDPGYVLPPGQPVLEHHPNGYRSVAMRLEAAALQQRLSALLGEEITTPIIFEQPGRPDFAFETYVRQPLLSAARELDHLEPAFQPAYLAELERMTLTRVLLHGRHSHSARFSTPAPMANARRRRRVEDYIEANWNKPLMLEDLVAVAGVSGRTLYRDFVDRHGMSPHDYIKRLRLTKARALLSQSPEASVMSIALACGFSSLGHFSRAYRELFGELPSTTKRLISD